MVVDTYKRCLSDLEPPIQQPDWSECYNITSDDAGHRGASLSERLVLLVLCLVCLSPPSVATKFICLEEEWNWLGLGLIQCTSGQPLVRPGRWRLSLVCFTLKAETTSNSEDFRRNILYSKLQYSQKRAFCTSDRTLQIVDPVPRLRNRVTRKRTKHSQNFMSANISDRRPRTDCMRPLYSIYGAAQRGDVRTIIHIYIQIAHMLIVYVGLAQARPNNTDHEVLLASSPVSPIFSTCNIEKLSDRAWGRG